MAYRFNGTSDYVEFAVSPFAGYTFGACTIAVFLKRASAGSNQDAVQFATSVVGLRFGFRFTAADKIRLVTSAGSGLADGPQVLTTGSTWYLMAITWAGGASMPRMHVHNGTSWNHANPASETAADTALVAGDRLFVGRQIGSGLYLPADIVCAGIKKADSSDATVETLSRTAWSAWTGFGFDWLIGFDSSLESAGILQDQASPGTGDEIAIGGTTAVSDPAGWAWGAAAAAFVPQIVIA